MQVNKDTFVNDELNNLTAANDAAAKKAGDDTGAKSTVGTPRNVLIVTCMDERNTTIEEWFNLEPGKELVYFSGGGRISLETLDRVYGHSLNDDKVTSIIYLVAHQCFDNPHAGCAAFKNDTGAQKEYFTRLREEIISAHPSAVVHVLALDTTSGQLRELVADPRDVGHLAMLIARSKTGLLVFEKEDEGHAGYGIYIGDAYRAWVADRNKYFSISADNPDIAGNAEIALNVMRGDHSKMDMATTPVIIIADFPIHDDEARTAAARSNMLAGLAAIRNLDGVQEGIAEGSIRIIECETHVRTKKGAFAANSAASATAGATGIDLRNE